MSWRSIRGSGMARRLRRLRRVGNGLSLTDDASPPRSSLPPSIAAPASASPAKPLVLAFGDSLTAGYGLDPGLGFAPQLQATLRRHGIAARVADGGVSGDTSAAGRARLALDARRARRQTRPGDRRAWRQRHAARARPGRDRAQPRRDPERAFAAQDPHPVRWYARRAQPRSRLCPAPRSDLSAARQAPSAPLFIPSSSKASRPCRAWSSPTACIRRSRE